MDKTKAETGSLRAALEQAGLEVGTDISRVANNVGNKVPSVVVTCRETSDVQRALKIAGERKIPVAICGGGYSPGGLGILDDGMVIDLALMKSIHVESENQLVHVAGGVTAGELETELAKYGLALTLPVPSRAGVIGAALSGGVGLLVRRQGLICDSMVEATLVTTKGAIIQADDDSEPELMWALRGSGGNLGVVTETVFQAEKITELTMMNLVFDESDLSRGLDFYSIWGPSLSEEVTAVAFIRRIPPLPGVPPSSVGEPGLVVVIAHSGDPATAAAELDELVQQVSPLAAPRRRCTPLEMRHVSDAGFSASHFGGNIRSGWADVLLSEDIEELALLAKTLPNMESTVELAHMGGAIDRPQRPSSAPGRSARFLLNVFALWIDQDDPSAVRRWEQKARTIIDRMRRDDALIPGFISADETLAGAVTYGKDFPRLQELKTNHDPDNLLHQNLNISSTTLS